MEKDLKRENAVVYALSNEGADGLKRMKESEKLGGVFVFLSDPEAKAAGQFAGRAKGPDYFNAATFVIGAGGKVTYAHVNEDYATRPTAETVLAEVRKARRGLKETPPPTGRKP